MARVELQMPQETKDKGIDQAAKLGLNLSEYVRLVIELDAATGIIEKLRKSK